MNRLFRGFFSPKVIASSIVLWRCIIRCWRGELSDISWADIRCSFITRVPPFKVYLFAQYLHLHSSFLVVG